MNIHTTPHHARVTTATANTAHAPARRFTLHRITSQTQHHTAHQAAPVTTALIRPTASQPASQPVVSLFVPKHIFIKKKHDEPTKVYCQIFGVQINKLIRSSRPNSLFHMIGVHCLTHSLESRFQNILIIIEYASQIPQS